MLGETAGENINRSYYGTELVSDRVKARRKPVSEEGEALGV